MTAPSRSLVDRLPLVVRRASATLASRVPLPVPRRRGTIGFAVVAMLGLSGCSSDLQPGAAAKVNDVRISQDKVDDIVGAACEYTEVAREQSGGGEPQRLDELRSTITTALIQFEIVNDTATERRVSASAAAVSQVAEQTQIPAEVSAANRETLEAFFADFATSQGQQAAIGANVTDAQVTSISEVTPEDLEAAADVLAEVTQDQDVVVNPAYGTWNGEAVTAGNGSLSDAVSDASLGSAGGEDPGLTASADPSSDAADVSAVQFCG